METKTFIKGEGLKEGKGKRMGNKEQDVPCSGQMLFDGDSYHCAYLKCTRKMKVFFFLENKFSWKHCNDGKENIESLTVTTFVS